MKRNEKQLALQLRRQGVSIRAIAEQLGVAKSSVSTWVREISLSDDQVAVLMGRPYTSLAVERRRASRLANEQLKRSEIQRTASQQVGLITQRELWLTGILLYWAEGGKTQRLVRFSNSDPAMIAVMMRFFREICTTPEAKFRAHVHIHSHLDYRRAEQYWSKVTKIPTRQFFKTYRRPSVPTKTSRDTLPYGVLDVYVLDARLFLTIKGWIDGFINGSLVDNNKTTATLTKQRSTNSD